MVLKQEEMLLKAEVAFEDFKRVMKEKTGSEFAEGNDEDIARVVFVNAYMKAIDDIIRMSNNKRTDVC